MRFLASCLMVLSMAAPLAAEDVLISPYRDQRSTEIRGLTEKEISDLRAGRGMALARTAELNGYPGPRHVLDAAQEGRLQLSVDQERTVQRLFDDMAREAQRLGNMILAEEANLEREFRARTIREADLEAGLGRIAALQAKLSAVHLRAHIETRPVLSAQQITHYDQLRGYTTGSPQEHGQQQRH